LLASSSPHSIPVNATKNTALTAPMILLASSLKELTCIIILAEQTNFRKFSQQLQFYRVRLSLSGKKNVKQAERMRNNVDNRQGKAGRIEDEKDAAGEFFRI
jgi:hypothetical protein